MKLSKRLLLAVVSIFFCASMAMAQQAADKLYNEGLKLQKTMTVKAQNQAISKFNSAKQMYDSAAKKSQCDNSIAVSRQIISDLSGKSKSDGKSKGSKSNKSDNSNSGPTPQKAAPTLDVSTNYFELPLDAKTLTVNVVTNQDSWEASTVACADGSSFLRVERSGSNEIRIIVPKNYSAGDRTQKVMVSAGGIHKDITVVQNGVPVTLDANEKQLKFGKKGGKKKITVSCNAQLQYENNANENWYVESKPYWVTVTINEKKSKGWLKDKLDKGTDLLFGKSENSDDVSLVKSSITIGTDAIPSASADYANGRKGEIILKSGSTTLTIYVTQQ